MIQEDFEKAIRLQRDIDNIKISYKVLSDHLNRYNKSNILEKVIINNLDLAKGSHNIAFNEEERRTFNNLVINGLLEVNKYLFELMYDRKLKFQNI